MANAFLASPSLGLLVAVAIAIHNIPEEFAMAVPAVATKKRSFLFKAACLSGAAEPAGAFSDCSLFTCIPLLNPFLWRSLVGQCSPFLSLLEFAPLARTYGIGSFLLGLVGSALVYLALQNLMPQ